MDLAKTATKLRCLTIQELGQLQSAICREFHRRNYVPSETQNGTMLGDPDGDVLMKHHGVTEQDAMDDFYEQQ